MSTKVQKVTRLHREAMDFTDRSFVARRYNRPEEYRRFSRLAYEKEAEAAQLMVNEEDIEPTRSILHRSAATLAVQCGEYEAAQRLIYRALAGNPPSDIEAELKDLLGKVELALAELPVYDKAAGE